MRHETKNGAVTVYLGLGSSLGNRDSNLRDAIRRLDAPDFRISAVSSLYESPHLGLKPNDAERYPPHYNCALKAETALSPQDILRKIRNVEDAGGRQRTEHWGPRTIDIDLLLYDTLVLQSDELTVPHPALAERAFVLRPLAELAPDLVLPNGATVAERLNALEIVRQPLEIVAREFIPGRHRENTP